MNYHEMCEKAKKQGLAYISKDIFDDIEGLPSIDDLMVELEIKGLRYKVEYLPDEWEYRVWVVVQDIVHKGIIMQTPLLKAVMYLKHKVTWKDGEWHCS